jgi:phenylalanine-4-hydroxylase
MEDKDITLLRDHADMRMVSAELDQVDAQRNQLVQLNPDHPGFRDASYRARRNEIARLAMTYQGGSPIPDAPYTAEEDKVWQSIREVIAPQHKRYACLEYLECLGRLNLPHDRIPQLSEVSAKVQAISGFWLEVSLNNL